MDWRGEGEFFWGISWAMYKALADPNCNFTTVFLIIMCFFVVVVVCK